ncbi:hypothetical protein PANDA_004467 [Ailuropoda melanoleuca]|uniref:Uncharacterized protein n=1 Tax=Ailuropoda melanoleuca TaxID=9646 RepID=D2H408_AILME|nr:hypothetical protein PANDA_004467 [Ailuropoda melanoleuca]
MLVPSMLLWGWISSPAGVPMITQKQLGSGSQPADALEVIRYVHLSNAQQGEAEARSAGTVHHSVLLNSLYLSGSEVSAAELRRIRETRGADTRAHTGLPFSRLLGSPRSSGSHRSTATSSSPRTPRQDPRRGHLHLGLCTPGLPTSQPRLSVRRSSGPQLGLLDFLCRGASPLESDLQKGSVESEHSLFRATGPCILTDVRRPSSFTAKLIFLRQTTIPRQILGLRHSAIHAEQRAKEEPPAPASEEAAGEDVRRRLADAVPVAGVSAGDPERATCIRGQATSLGLGEPGTWGQVLASAWRKGDATLFPRLSKRSHLAVANTDIPASLSLLISNEEVIADPVLTAHALLVGHFPSSGKWSMEAIPFVNAEAPWARSTHPCADLNGNNITRITKTDFAGLRHLRVLQLMENKISAIERGAFQDLKELERLLSLLSKHARYIPEFCFTSLQAGTAAIRSVPSPCLVRGPLPCGAVKDQALAAFQYTDVFTFERD